MIVNIYVEIYHQKQWCQRTYKKITIKSVHFGPYFGAIFQSLVAFISLIKCTNSVSGWLYSGAYFLRQFDAYDSYSSVANVSTRFHGLWDENLWYIFTNKFNESNCYLLFLKHGHGWTSVRVRPFWGHTIIYPWRYVMIFMWLCYSSYSGNSAVFRVLLHFCTFDPKTLTICYYRPDNREWVMQMLDDSRTAQPFEHFHIWL